MIEFLGVVEQQLRPSFLSAETFERRLGRCNGGVGRFQAILGRRRIRFRGSNHRSLRLDVGRGLNVLNPRDHLVFVNVIAFLHQQLHDPALGVGADVDVIAGFNFARSGDKRGQILARDSAGLHGYQISLAPAFARVNRARDRQGRKYEQKYLPLTFHLEGISQSVTTPFWLRKFREWFLSLL